MPDDTFSRALDAQTPSGLCVDPIKSLTPLTAGPGRYERWRLVTCLARRRRDQGSTRRSPSRRSLLIRRRYRQQATVRVPPRVVGALLRRVAEDSGAAADHRARVLGKSFPACCSPRLQGSDAARTHCCGRARCPRDGVPPGSNRDHSEGAQGSRSTSYHSITGRLTASSTGSRRTRSNCRSRLVRTARTAFGSEVRSVPTSLRSSTENKSECRATRTSGPAISSTSDRSTLLPDTTCS